MAGNNLRGVNYKWKKSRVLGDFMQLTIHRFVDSNSRADVYYLSERKGRWVFAKAPFETESRWPAEKKFSNLKAAQEFVSHSMRAARAMEALSSAYALADCFRLVVGDQLP